MERIRILSWYEVQKKLRNSNFLDFSQNLIVTYKNVQQQYLHIKLTCLLSGRNWEPGIQTCYFSLECCTHVCAHVVHIFKIHGCEGKFPSDAKIIGNKNRKQRKALFLGHVKFPLTTRYPAEKYLISFLKLNTLYVRNMC